MQKQKLRYAVITSAVRQDQNICFGAKLLYGEITALCNREGLCRTSNGYFAGLFNKPESVIRQWIAALKKGGHIEIRTGSSAHEVNFKHARGVRLIGAAQ
ncbi:MAG: hypothetical protein LBJ31_06060 [Treponema sp.]|jgi:hypothetical protein|nr:hypothetical protein [Treponema sp.]